MIHIIFIYAENTGESPTVAENPCFSNNSPKYFRDMCVKFLGPIISLYELILRVAQNDLLDRSVEPEKS